MQQAATYTTGEVSAIVGANVRQLNEFVMRGAIRPSARMGSRSGEHHQWSVDDLVILSVLDHARELGLGYPMLAAIADALRKFRRKMGPLENVKPGTYVAVRADGAYTVARPDVKNSWELLAEGQFVAVCPLYVAAQRVKAALAAKDQNN